MSGSNKLLILFCFIFSSGAHAFDVFGDALYWQATETVDWVLQNDRNLPNQNIHYQTIGFNYKPGFRVGVNFKDVWDCNGGWDSKFTYTRYHTAAVDSASGNLVSTFLGGKLVQGTRFYQTGQINFTIDFNMFDWDLSKNICVTDSLLLRPAIGLRGGSINQKIITSFQGPISITETVKNNFRGIGPKVGIESRWAFCRVNNYLFSLVSDFSTSYLKGRWAIRDVTHDSISTTVRVKDGKRNLGAFTIQGMMGINLDYQCFSAKLGYEISDWFDQYQVLDDGTGGHENDLILQGITLRLSYDF